MKNIYISHKMGWAKDRMLSRYSVDMKWLPVYLLFVLFFTSPLSAQQLYPHPVLLLLGTDLAEMGDINTGLNAYDGIGSCDLLLAHSWQEGKRMNLSWIPSNGIPNGWGLLQLQQNSGRYISFSGSDKGAYEVAANLNWNTRSLGVQRTLLRTQGNQRLADRNQDGFRDQLAYSHYNFQHQTNVNINNINFKAYAQYFGQRQHGGETNYNWKKQAGSDSIYGFGHETNQWIGGISANHNFRQGRDLYVNANWRLHQEDAHYGQRQLTAQERRTGMAVNYHQEYKGGAFHVFSFYQRQVIQQNWDGWSFNPSWDKLAIGGQYRRFLTSSLLVEGSLSVDYHTAVRWQLLPNLRFDYLLGEKLRLGIIGGRNYRWQQATTALKPYLVSQRRWQLDSYGPDRLWYLGGLIQSKKVEFDNWELSSKAVYQARLLTEQLVTDPTQPGELSLYHRSGSAPWQHLLLLTAQARGNNVTGSVVYRWRDKPLALRNVEGQSFFESRHSLLAQLGYQKNINRSLQWLKLSTDYLLRSPQRLTSEQLSPYLHHWRCQLDLEWDNVNNKKNRWRPSTFFGVENLLNQQQEEVYVAATAPFSAGFDGSSRWGDPVGRRWYAGLRLGF